MPILAKINFDDIYEIERTPADFKSSFKTELVDGTSEHLHIRISADEHELLANVYNLAFGPLNTKGQIDDVAKLPHANYSKVFSTILFDARTYLYHNPDHSLDIDGSNNARAYLYHRIIQRNYIYLTKYFNILGIKYYVRITRFGKNQYDNPFDFNDIHSLPQPIEKMTKPGLGHMFNYFILKLKS